MFDILWKAKKYNSLIATLKTTLNILDLNKVKMQGKSEFAQGHYMGYMEGLQFALNAMEREDKQKC